MMYDSLGFHKRFVSNSFIYSADSRMCKNAPSPTAGVERWASALKKKRSPIPRKRLNLSLLPPNPSLRTLTSLFVAVMSLERDHYYIFHEGKTLEFSIFSFYMIHLCLNLVFPLITHSHSMKVVMAFILHTKWHRVNFSQTTLLPEAEVKVRILIKCEQHT